MWSWGSHLVDVGLGASMDQSWAEIPGNLASRAGLMEETNTRVPDSSVKLRDSSYPHTATLTSKVFLSRDQKRYLK